MKLRKAFSALILSGAIATPASASMLVNLMEMPKEGEVIAAGGGIKSSVEYDTKMTAKGYTDSDTGKITFEGKSLVLSGMYGLSETFGVFAGGVFLMDTEFKDVGDIDGKDFYVGGYSSLDLLENTNTNTIAYAQYRMVNWSTTKDYDGSEIIVGLLGVSKRKSGLKLYAGPEFVISSEIESDPFASDYCNAEKCTNELERKNSFGLRIGFSKALEGSDMHVFGGAALMHEQTFFIGVSTSL